MRLLRICYWRLYGLIFKSRVERDMWDEMEFHVRMRTALNEESGQTKDEARRAATRRFGRASAIIEHCRDIKGGGVLETSIADLRFGLRSLRRNPGFAAVAILTLALGIGATSSMFSVVRAVLIRPLQFKDMDRLVQISSVARSRAEDSDWVQYADVLDLRQQSTSFESIGVQGFEVENYNRDGQAEALYGSAVSWDLFPTLGVKPALGRDFVASEDEPGRNHVILLSWDLWQRQFGADPAIVGRHMVLTGTMKGSPNGDEFEIVGVMPSGFNFPLDIPTQVPLATRQMAFWVPMGEGHIATSRYIRGCRATARMRPGVSLSQAQADVDRVAARLEQQYPDSNAGRGMKIVPLADHIFGGSRGAMLILMGATGLVLLIGCANIANLLLARAAGRTRETAVRIALGAGRLRIVRQQVTENVLLSVLGGTAGVVIAEISLGFVIKVAPQDIPRLTETSVNAGVLVFAFGVSILAGILFTLLPALHATRGGVHDALKESSNRSTGGAAKSRFRDLLVVAEIALAVLLTIGAGLMTKSFSRLMSVDTGYSAQNVFTGVLVPAPSRYPDYDAEVQFFKRVVQKVRALPGVISAGAVDGVPMGGNTNGNFVQVEGRPVDDVGENRPVSEVFSVTAEYLQSMGIGLVKGRYLNDLDDQPGFHNALINKEAARRFWPGEEPIGKRIGFGDASGQLVWHTVVGIVQDTRDQALDRPVLSATYISDHDSGSAPNFLVAKTDGPPDRFYQAIRSAVAAVDKDQPVFVETTMQDLVDNSVAPRRFAMVMLAAFSGLAFIMSAIGIYGLISYSVAGRTRELGIRTALGARRSRLLLLVLEHGLKLSLAGALMGAASALALTRLLTGLLYNVRSTDPAVFVFVCLAFVAVAIVATVIPARRAATVDPIGALRSE